MATIAQIEANRLNAQKSAGPRSVVGKAVSCMNALKSGIDAKSQVIRGEKPADLQTLTGEYMERFHPATPEERHYVDTLVREDWQLRRLAKADAQIWEYEMETACQLQEDCPLGQAFGAGAETFTRLQRRIDAAQRSYGRALAELERLQASRETKPAAAAPVPEPAPQTIEPKIGNPQIGFVPPSAPRIATPAQPMRLRPPQHSGPVSVAVLQPPGP